MTGALQQFAADDNSGGAAVGVVIFVLIAAAFYLIPTIIAAIRHVPNAGSVFVINLFLGWTLIGWVVAMAMAARSQYAPSVINVHQGFAGPAPTPPGWYPDPHRRGGQRYSDGYAWTNHTA